jgi:hypothetical protein
MFGWSRRGPRAQQLVGREIVVGKSEETMIDFYQHHPEMTVDLVRHEGTGELCYLVRKTTSESDTTELWSRADLMRFYLLCFQSFTREAEYLNETLRGEATDELPSIKPGR